MADHFDVVNLGGMHGESSLDAHAVSHAADGESFADAAVLLRDDGAFVGLKPFAVALDDFDEDLDLVADCDFGQIRSHALFFDSVDNVHC